ncbi:MAG: winged helix-turn-helix transcriptional regulator [Methanofollis sp.]|uniref:winged helix-turn-helix transcriptional regulator n=1 Tax=Methanofollis sp. TaxID=2052835 RepID=UPI00260B909E|nr:winged helix-turn-helix transcriptional regulator [Methanofollis sp.]MDD4254531.1 winged helix-turn-helix transcriptional regulator [Methanofollis sp.]
MEKIDPCIVLTLVLLLLVTGNPAAAKIVFEPGPSEMPTDMINVDDEYFVPWWTVPPMRLASYFAIIHSPKWTYPIIDIIFSLSGAIVIAARDRRRHPLDNEKRKAIYACIRESPGISFAEIVHVTGISRGTAQYHIICLRAAHLIRAVRRDSLTGYFESKNTCGPMEQTILLHLRSPTEEQILTLLLETPDLSQSEIAGAVGVAGPTVAWHMKRLIADGIVESERNGRATRYRLTAEAAGALRDTTFGEDRTGQDRESAAA